MKKVKLLILSLSAIILTSCIPFGDIFGSNNERPKTNGIYESTDNNYKHPVLSDESNYYKREENPYSNKVIGNSKGVSSLNSVGNQKILVVPLSFTDTAGDYSNEAQIKTTLNNVFFGESSDTGWESVSSFYEKSSYNALHLTGEVTNIIHLNYTTKEFEKLDISGDEYWDQSHYAIEDVYNSDVLSSAKLREYDKDNNGFVDAVFFIYLAPISGDVFWAYQYYWNRAPWNENKENGRPVFNTYAWASYEFIREDSNYNETRPAAHTYIHETGHMFGLDDYYDYDGKSAPIGGVDMMDNNIIDHNMYSKYILNWATPYVPLGDSEIYLRPAESSGDFILINNNWNGHAYDEYILIEYYTPTGLNQHDSMGEGYGKGDKKVAGFNVPGVRIYHVDSRIAEMRGDLKGNPFPYIFRDSLETINPNFYLEYVTSNTPTTSYVTNFKRIHLLDGGARQNNWYHQVGLANSSLVLFGSGKEIKNTEWRKYLFSGNTFNDNSAIGYSVLIGDMDEAGVTIKLTAA